ncbi:MAG TPA: hypothetical protein VGE60_08085 [Telluria sp.]
MNDHPREDIARIAWRCARDRRGFTTNSKAFATPSSRGRKNTTAVAIANRLRIKDDDTDCFQIHVRTADRIALQHINLIPFHDDCYMIREYNYLASK